MDTANNRIELLNPSGAFQDVSGWELIFYDSVSWPAPRWSFLLPTPLLVPPGGVFEVRAGGSTPGVYPIFFTGSPLSWTTSGGAAVWLRSPGGASMDFVCAASAFASMISAPGPVASTDWSGVPLATNGVSTRTYQRIGVGDHNNAADWVITNRTTGSVNPGLNLPFSSTPVRVPVVPMTATFTNGQWTGNLDIQTNDAWVFLRADDQAGHPGDSDWFRITAGPPLALQGPATADESSAGFAGLGNVLLPFAVATNVSVILASTLPAEISVPPTVTVLAGQTNASFSITNYDDSDLDGIRVAVISAQAAGFAPISATMSNLDNEVATLTWSAPATVTEGNTVLFGAAQVRVDRPPAFPVAVALSSSNPKLVVPSLVYISAGQTSAPVDLTLVDNSRIDGPQSVALHANVPGWTPADVTVVVKDNESTNLTLTVTTPVWEGSGTISNAGSVRIGGTLSRDLTVWLTSDLPSKLTVPANVLIPAGQTSVLFSVTTTDDGTNDGNQLVHVSAQASDFAGITNTITVRDNDVDHFVVSSLASAQLAGTNIAVTIQSFNRDGVLIIPFNGFATLSASNASGPIAMTPTAIGPFTNGVWAGVFQIPMEATGAVVTVSDGNGHIGTSKSFDLVEGTLLNLPLSDLAFDATRGKLWAAVKSGAATGAQSVVEIDLATGAFGSIVPLGTEPGGMAISDDGQFLYVALVSTGGVARVNLSSNDIDLRFAVGVAGTIALRLGVLPGDAHALIAQIGSADAGTALYRDGVRKPDIIGPPSPNTAFFDFYSSSSNFFYSNPGGFYWLNVKTSGLAIVRGAANPPYAGQSVHANGLLFFSAGDVVEPRDLRRLGAYPTNGLVAADANAGEVFFVSGNRLRTFDLPSFAELASTALPLSGTDTLRFVRCASNALAVGTSGGKLLLLRSKNVRQPTFADLSVTQSVSSAVAVIQSNLTYFVTVSNAGPALATNVVLVDVLPVDSTLTGSVSSQGACVFTNGILSCPIGSLAPGESATVEFAVQPATPGPLRNVCWTTGDGINPTNAMSVLESKAVFGPVVPGWTRLRINSTALAYDSARNVLWTASQRFADVIDYSLRSVALSNGLPQTAIRLGYSTTKIALSADRSYLYAAYANDQDGLAYTPDNYLARANFTSMTIDQTVPVVDMYGQQHAVVDLIGVASFPSAVAVARSGPQNDIALYQSGTVIRRSPTDAGAGKLETNPTIPTRLYRLRGTGYVRNVLRLDIGVSNIDMLTAADVFSTPPSPSSPVATDMRYAAGHLFSDIGLVADAESLVLSAQLPIVGLVQPDVSAGLVYFVTTISGTNQILTAFDINTLLPAWSFVIPGVVGAPANLVSCGSGLLAFRTSEDELFIFNPPLLPHELRAELALTATCNATSAIINSPVTFTSIVWNNGPAPATGVCLTNRLPAGAIVTSITGSQGSVTNVGNVITANLGNLSAGTYAVLQVVVTLNNAGVLTNLAAVTSSVSDAIVSNNVASAAVQFITIPNADLGVSQSIIDGLPATVGTNLTYSVVLTNRGPDTASNSFLINTFEAGSAVISAQVSQGTVSWDSGKITAQFGDLTNGGKAVLTFVLGPTCAGLAVNTAVIGSSISDPISSNNQSIYAVQIVNPSPPDTFREFRLRTTDIVYDPGTGKIRAGVLSDEPVLSNSVVQLDPVTGEITNPIVVGVPFGMLAISDDAQYLYLGRTVTGGVGRIFLPAKSVDLSFDLFPPDPPRYSSVNDMKVMPGQPHVLAVSVNQGQSNIGLWVYDDGIPRTNFASGTIYGGSHPIAFGATSNVLYETYPSAFRTIAVDASGVQVVRETNSFLDVGFEFDAGRVYFQSGRVGDPVTATVIGFIPISGLVAPDSAHGRVYFATSSGSPPPNYLITVRSFDTTNFVEQWAVRLPLGTGAATRLIKLGTNGLAVATDAGRVYVVRQPGNPTVDLSLQNALSQTFASTGSIFTCTLTLQNNGPWTATGLTVSDPLPGGFALVSATVPGGSYVVSNNVVVCSLPPLANGAAVTATLQLTAATAGTFTNSATASSVEPDLNPTNNTAVAVLMVTPTPSLSASDVLVREGDIIASLSVPLSLSGPSGNAVTVQFQTLDGTAIAGQDYNAASGSITFSPGTTNRSIPISAGLRGNTLVESNRYYFVRLTNAVNAVLAQTLVKITILDDDYNTLTVSNVSVPEGNTGNTGAVFAVRLLNPSAQTVRVDYRVSSLTATSGQDFLSRSGTLAFAPGVTNVTVSVVVTGDALFEANESFLFELINPVGAVVVVNSVQGTIINDDPFPPFAVTTVDRVGDTMRLTFETLSGTVYRVERSQTLLPNDWTTVVDQIVGTGGLVEVEDSTFPGAALAFYRVRRLP
jgi:uncharacterized repeat protein (TIGR01451 family)